MMRGTRGQVWLVAVLTIGVWFVAAPRSASADCVTFYVSGSSDGAYVEGSATIWLDIEGCWGEEYTGDVDVEVAVDGPGGWNFDLDSGYAYATASTFVAINGQYGTYDVDGDGYAHYVWWYSTTTAIRPRFTCPRPRRPRRRLSAAPVICGGLAAWTHPTTRRRSSSHRAQGRPPSGVSLQAAASCLSL